MASPAPGPTLTPADAKGRALMEQWSSVEDSYFSKPALKVIGERVFKPMFGQPTDEANVEAGKGEPLRTLDVLDAHLARVPFSRGTASRSRISVTCRTSTTCSSRRRAR